MIKYTVKVFSDGSRHWWLNGQRHREDGPAIERADGGKSWALNDEFMSEEEHAEATAKIEEMTMEEVCKALGKNIKIKK